MDNELKRKFKGFVKRHEGNIAYPYVDSNGIITPFGETLERLKQLF